MTAEGPRGLRWGAEGPPPEAYERISDPEQFRGLHTAGQELLDQLTGRYQVQREEFLDHDRPYAPEPGALLLPDQPGAASFGLTFTEAPGVVPWYAGRHHGHLPYCACDACDTTLAECIKDLHELAELVVTGGFGEHLSIEQDRWWHTTWKLIGPSRRRVETSRPISDDEATRLLERMPDGHQRWDPWALRPPARVPDRTRTDADHGSGCDTGVVRSWRPLDGWGVVDSPSTPGGCWVHYSAIDAPGFRTLLPGQGVQLGWERADQDGYRYRATRVAPQSARPPA